MAEPNLTTRRGFSKWLAAVGIAAVPAPSIAATEEPSPQLLELAGKLVDAFDCLDKTADDLNDKRNTLQVWLDANPEPNSDDEKYDFVGYERVLGRERNAWLLGRQAEMTRIGMTPALRAHKQAQEAYDAAIADVTLARCHSKADLLLKARLARSYDYKDEIAGAVVFDMKDVGI